MLTRNSQKYPSKNGISADCLNNAEERDLDAIEDIATDSIGYEKREPKPSYHSIQVPDLENV